MQAETGTVVCVLDGLDECQDDSDNEPGRQALISKLRCFYSTVKHNVCMYSRLHQAFLSGPFKGASYFSRT
jgi:hypothetical protein